MKGREKGTFDECKEINNWSYHASCMNTSLPVPEFKNFKLLIFVAKSVRSTHDY
jgi:hypothetical protein